MPFITNGTALKIAGWISVFIAVGGLIWKAAEFRTEVRTDMSWVKTSLSTLVTRFNELDVMKVELRQMDSNGTAAMKDTVARLNSFQQQISSYREFGSPAMVKRVEAVESRLDRVEKDIEVHIKTTTKPQ